MISNFTSASLRHLSAETMVTTRPCLAPMSRICHHTLRTPISLPAMRWLSSTSPLQKAPVIKSKKKLDEPKKKDMKKKKVDMGVKKKKISTTYKEPDLSKMETFSLVDAIRYLRAFEVGQIPTSVKYEMHVKLKGLKNGPVVRNRLRLPHPVKTDVRICVICPSGSKYALEAKAAGAVLVGEEEVFEAVKDGKIEFDRCICQTDSMDKMTKAGLGRILGPRGLMPSTKLGTIVKDPAAALKELVGGAEYRERMGVVRMAVGQLGFSPDELQRNVKAFMEAIKKDIVLIQEKINKEVSQIVLSSTHGPGFPLNGNFKSENSIDTRLLSGPN